MSTTSRVCDELCACGQSLRHRRQSTAPYAQLLFFVQAANSFSPTCLLLIRQKTADSCFQPKKKTIFPSLLIQLRISTRVPISLVDMATHMQMSPYISCKFPHCHLATACYISLLFFRLRKESMKVVGRIVTMATRVALSESLYRRKHAHHCDYVALIRVCFFESI